MDKISLLNKEPMNVVDQVKKCLENSFKDSRIEILDPMQDQTHLEAIVISDSFEGKTLLEQHRLVMKPLKDSFTSYLHALKVKTYTFKTWNQLPKEKLCLK
ncbi:MAG: DNA-binding transcriptional regulator BolA [Chlamydiae bacterium]|nr:DNA-binding transcriptional regulator BolA [Chlamydiota bacterium]